MSKAAAQITTFRMTVTDAYDGAIRILTDAQRFGLDLISLDLCSRQPGHNADGCGADVTIVLSGAGNLEHKLLAARFVRHPAVLRVHAGRAAGPQDGEYGESATIVAA